MMGFHEWALHLLQECVTFRLGVKWPTYLFLQILYDTYFGQSISLNALQNINLLNSHKNLITPLY